MNLSNALSTAQTIFSHTGTQSAALAQNIANASNPDYSRRVGVLSINSAGAQTLSIERTYDNGLVKQTMYAISDSSAQDMLQSKLDTIASLLGGNDFETSPSTYIAALRDNLQAYATKPNESTLASTVVSSARDVSNSLNNISAEIQGIRAEIDTEIKNSITELNSLMAQFDGVNNAIKAGTALGKDVNNELDVRDGLLKNISSIVGIRTFTRSDNDMVIYTSDGTMLYDSGPRDILFTPTSAYAASTTGGKIIIDGQAVTIGDAGNTTGKGSLQALLQVRDEIVPTFQKQLDETARGLIEIFQQTDVNGVKDPLPGLFTYGSYAAGDTLPASGVWVPGLSAEIRVNSALIKSQGGDPTRLRDGGYDVDSLGVSDPDFVHNTTSDAGYAVLLDSFVTEFETERNFDSETDLDVFSTITNFSSESVGWLSQLISESAAANEAKSAKLSRVVEALSNTTGVSLDEEMSLMLDLEQSYKASSKLVTATDEMIQALLNAV